MSYIIIPSYYDHVFRNVSDVPNVFQHAISIEMHSDVHIRLFPSLHSIKKKMVSRLARNKTQVVMQRLEEKFFLSPKIFEAMDQDQSLDP